MKITLKKYISLVLTVCFLLSAFCINIVYAENKKIVIYHTNDSHGYLQGDGEKIVGISIAAALKNSTPDSILVDAGDATQGLPIASLTKGADIIDLMNIAGYDVMTLGNHEFDFGVEQLLNNVKRASFPVISANVYRNDEPILKNIQKDNNGCHTIIERNGIKVGFFGITTVQTATATNPEGIKDVVFREEIESAKKEIDELESEEADFIIALCHMGNGDAPCTSIDFANAMTGEYQGKLNAIIDGHSHTIENTVQNDILIVQTGYGMSSIGKLTIISNENISAINDKLLTPKDLTEIEPDLEVIKKIDKINYSQQELLKEKIAVSENTLWAGWINDICPVRLVETNFGDFVADAFRNSAVDFNKNSELEIPIVAVQNGGGIREAIINGEITKGSLISAFPFSNTIYMKEITPKILYDIMEVSGSELNGQNAQTGMLLQDKISGGFLQISGFNVHFNPNGSENNKVVSITIDGQNKPLEKDDNSTKIMLVSNNYIMSGGNGYTMLSDLPKYAEIGGELEIIQNYLQSCLKNGLFKGYENIKNRIIIRDDYYPKDYNAFIRITDKNGNLKANQPISYRVDGGKRQNAVTDENAILSVKLNDGSHGVRLADTQSEVYVDNYSGIGLIEDNIRKFPALTYLNDGSCDPIIETSSETQYYKKTSKGGSVKRNIDNAANINKNEQNITESTTESTTENVTDEVSEKTTETINNTENLKSNKNKKIISITLGSNEIKIDKKSFNIDSAPYISNDSIMVPLRAVYIAVYGQNFENADENDFIIWNNSSKTATVFADESVVKFTAGSEFVITDRNSFTMDNMAKAEIKNGRMFIPFRALGKALGIDVNWIEESKTALFMPF